MEASAQLGDDLPLGVDAGGAGAAAADTAAATEEALKIGKGGEFDGGLAGIDAGWRAIR